MKEAAPPRWKRRPSSLVDASLNPFNRWSDDGIEASGLRHLGPSCPGVWLKSLLRAPQTVQTECRLAWRSVHCPPKDQPHNWVETVGAGARTVRLLLRSAQGEYRPCRAPPIRCTHYPPANRSCASVLTLIAFEGEITEIQTNVPNFGAGGSERTSPTAMTLQFLLAVVLPTVLLLGLTALLTTGHLTFSRFSLRLLSHQRGIWMTGIVALAAIGAIKALIG